MGRRRSKSPSSTELSARCAWASARLTAVKVLPSAGEGLVTTTVCRGCRVCRWFKRVRSVRNSSAGVSCELLRSSRCDSGAGWKGTMATSASTPGWMFSRTGGPGSVETGETGRNSGRRGRAPFPFASARGAPAGPSRQHPLPVRPFPPGAKHRVLDSFLLQWHVVGHPELS